MTIINFDDIIGKKFNTITNNIFCLSHPKNALIIRKTNSGKTNILMNLIAQNSIYAKIYIYTNNLDEKYKLLKNKFKDDVFNNPKSLQRQGLINIKNKDNYCFIWSYIRYINPRVKILIE